MFLVRLFLFFFVGLFSLQYIRCQDIEPYRTIQMDGSVEDFFLDGENIFIVGNSGELICIDYKTKTVSYSLIIPKITDFMGDKIQAKITCLDKDENTGKIILVAQGERGYQNVFVVDDRKIENVIKDTEKKWIITEARIVKPNHIVLTLLSSEIILFNYETKEIIYRKPIGHYALSDMDLNDTKTQIIIGDESGTISLINLNNGEVIDTFSSENVDKVNRVSFSKNIIVGGGQDRRLALYNKLTGSGWHTESGFLIYSLGMNEEADLLIYNEDETNALALFNIKTKRKVANLIGHEGIVTQIKFYDNNLITAGEDGKICWWDLTQFK